MTVQPSLADGVAVVGGDDRTGGVDVRLLLSNVDAARAVITADHGNAVGERGLYGHAAGLALRPLREVPWAATTATDSRTYGPPSTAADAAEQETASPEVSARLERLGYR